ncbi:hypothetical protein [Rhodococcus marinonascens]|uniref:hypothetical protein n=1 Tax=Rhodococcus marinonascens TaxID=38311 RepID=UPI00147542BA|nr:hypothetical protein [Rhodococcus marinonascens]
MLEEDEDSPEALFRDLHQLVSFINLNAGRLSNESVVAARCVTDTLREVIATAEARPLDIHAAISVRAISTDYLPTTLRSYLALDDQTVATVGRSGHTPRQLLLQQVDSLWEAATDILAATRSHDVDALTTQGNFLRTKFTRSDLDL